MNIVEEYRRRNLEQKFKIIIKFPVYIYNTYHTMLQHKQQFEPSTRIQECQFPIQQVQIQNCRYLQPSLFNKSSMRCVSITGAQLQQLPEIDPNTQKIDISMNKIRVFPLGFGNLKQIKIDNNYIERLPQEINDMECLRIIKANNNKINIIPFLKNIRHLELSNNPIRLITAKLHDTKLQYLVFDWIPFLVNIYFQSNDQGIIYALCDIIKNSVVDSIQQFIRFDELFPNRNHSLEVRYLLNKAINKKLDFFIQYLRDFQGNLNYNRMIYNQRPILQQVLQQKYEKALQLFKLRKSNINQPEVYITNLVFACRYRNYNFFCFLVENGFKRNIIKDNQMQIIETIFKSFDQNQNSVKMLQKILYLCNFTVHNKKTFYLPRNYSLIQAQNLCEGILYVMNHQHLNSLIDFQHSVSQVSLQPLLHFAMTNRKPELAQIILQRYKKPFVKNYSGKLAKTIRGSVFSRKLVWKYEKKVIKQLFEQQNITKTQIQRRKSVNNQKWFDTVYNQMAIPKLSRKKQLNKSFNYLEGSLISSRIQTMQRSIQERNMFRSLKSSKAQVPNQSCSQDLNQIDSTGILYQFALNMNKKSNRLISHNAGRKITPQMSNFSLYQLYQKNLQETTERSYKEKSKRMKTINSFSILTPWTLCQQVEDSDGQQQFIQYDRGRKGLCQNSCIDLQDTMMEVERQ